MVLQLEISASPLLRCSPHCQHSLSSFLKLPHFFTPKSFVATTVEEASGNISAAPISLPEGSWKQIGGEVTAAKGFNTAGMYAGLRASGKKPDLPLVTCDVDVGATGSMLVYELRGCCCDLSLLQVLLK